jgi:diadenosine tetraphosphate (Ap4A) HIT family hydrolase
MNAAIFGTTEKVTRSLSGLFFCILDTAMATLRLDETKAAYDAYQTLDEFKDTCPLCKAPTVKAFTYWRVVKNRFPYDKIAGVHDMLVPKRHITEKDINQDEWHELANIKEEFIHPNYQFMIEATHKTKSIPAHFHLHLIVLKD